MSPSRSPFSSVPTLTRFRAESEEVFYVQGEFVALADQDVVWLKERALTNPRRRARICAHPSAEHALHEMVIAHACGNYVPPHRHLGKSEAYLMVDGCMDIVLMTEAGAPCEVIRLAASGGSYPYYFRLSGSLYHTMIVRSDIAVYHEITGGPFRRENTEFAPWAPSDRDATGHIAAYVAALEQQIAAGLVGPHSSGMSS